MDRKAFWRRLGIIAALAAGLVLAGCGRKSGLDPPPSALNPNGTPQPAEQPPFRGSLFGEPPPLRAPAAAPSQPQSTQAPSPPKTFPLDFLIGK